MDMEMVYCSLAILAIIILLYKIINFSKPKKNHPPSPPSLPITGHLHLLKLPYHRTLHSLAQQYGPIFSLRLGRQPVLVVSSSWATEECLSQNDIVFANRPKTILGQHLGYNHSIFIWAPYGPHWRNLRRVATLTALSQKQIHLAGPARQAEIRVMIRDLIRSSKNETPKVNLTEVFSKLAVNLLTRVVTGKCKETNINNATNYLMTVCDYIPILRWVGYKGIEKRLINMNKERNVELQSWIDECRKNRADKNECKEKMLVEELLELQEDDPDYYTDDILKGIILILFVAGSDTTAKTLEWAMSNILNHPEVLEKAKLELDTNVDDGRLVNDSDVPKLNYIRNIIFETLRLFPPAPLLLPHYSSQDCTIGGYHVPKGTMLFVNAWSIQRDPALWKDSTKFIPERFESEKEEFKYMPFGIGRRACPGKNFALQNVTLVLATLIQCFDWSTIDGSVDLMEQAGGVIMPKERPLHVMCQLRSSMTDILSQI